MKRSDVCLILVGLCTACYVRAQSQPSQADAKAFVTAYVAAFNGKNMARLQALYDSRSRACLTGKDKDFYEALQANAWEDPVPANYTFTVSGINEINLKAIESMGRFALKPAYELHINYQQGNDLGSVDVYLVQENGRWFADQPCATEQTLKQFRDDAPARKEREAHYKSVADAIQEPLRSQLIALLRKHETATAIDQYKKASDQDYREAMQVIHQLKLALETTR